MTDLLTPTRGGAPATPDGVTRRRFLQAAVVTGSVAALDLRLLLGGDAAQAEELLAQAPLGAADHILVMVELAGGNDGLSSVVPYGDANYYGKRGALAVAANTVLPMAEGLGLHPSLPYLKSRWDGGDLAVVRGVGHPDLDHSHFSGIARVAAGITGNAIPTTGWLGRYLDGLQGGPFAGISVADGGVPLLLRGANSSVIGLPSWTTDLFGADRRYRYDNLAYGVLAALGTVDTGLGAWALRCSQTVQGSIESAQQVSPVYTPATDRTHLLASDLTVAARLINLDLGARVIHVRHGGFDTHSGQLNDYPKLMAELDLGLQTFFATLSPALASRVVVATFSEFGRRVKPNTSSGTDHGAASMAFVLGDRVRGGMYGQQPSLTALDARGDLVMNVDVRSVFGSLAAEWLRADDVQVLGQAFPRLGLIETGLGCAAAPVSGVPAQSAYTAINPVRILDTRDGTGGYTKLGPGRTIDVVVNGASGLPAGGIGAVAVNVTATGATASTYLTVWPSGSPRPTASNLNVSAGQTVPNLVLTKVGANGRVSIYNDSGDVHVLADAMGWFPDSNGFVPLVPSRILDTRNGIGAAKAKIGANGTLALHVAGAGGVPATGADAVVMNVTAAEPSAISYITAWPGGTARPDASNLNMAAGQTVPNLVICRVGADGNVNLYNAFGTVHLIADVMGWFPASAGFHALPPARILDTRSGLGAGRVAANAVVDIAGSCRGAVPVNARAVVINVTVTDPSADGYVTVWPTGTPQPNASNLNFSKGQTVPNLVICKVGLDGLYSVFASAASTHVIADVMGWFE